MCYFASFLLWKGLSFNMWDSILAGVKSANDAVNSVVWGTPMLALLLCTGIYLTVRSKFFQIRRARRVAGETIFAVFRKKSVTQSSDHKSISQFQALSTALASTVGTGNIAGVATALLAGGPGAVFWMWISAFFGMMTHYAEVVLGVFFRKRNDKGEWSGGAMYYLEEGLKEKRGLRHLAKPLAIAFAVFCVLASFGIGNMTQINSIADAMRTTFGISPLATGITLALIAGMVILGGIKRIGKVTEKLVPFMAVFYMAAALTIIVINYRQIPVVFAMIFHGAFNMSAVAGGVAGTIMKKAISKMCIRDSSQ